jgi:NAD(P)-dependent dehydrogenase (short-subunit alcohol dehydrogenase family)
MSKRFEGKTVLITGGSSGIGLTTAKRFHEEGARVAITGRGQKALDEAVAAIGDGTVAVPADVSSLADLDRLYALLKDKFGKLDVLFANAGVATFAPSADMTEQAFDLMVGINIKGLYFTVQKAIPLLTDKAAIVLGSSVVNSMGNPGTTVYAATKAAIRSFGRTFAAELVDRGVRVNTVSPGPILTPIMDKLGFSAPQRDDFLEGVKDQIPMKRLGTPDEVADAVLFLASNEASYVTGADLYVDGGQGQV